MGEGRYVILLIVEVILGLSLFQHGRRDQYSLRMSQCRFCQPCVALLTVMLPFELFLAHVVRRRYTSMNEAFPLRIQGA